MTRQNELKHYGVPGMKWGVIRDSRAIANHRQNVAVRKIKNQYYLGKISSDERRAAIRKENQNKKAYIQKVKSDLKNIQNKESLKSYRNNIARQAFKEIPSRKINKGLSTVNKMLGDPALGTMVSDEIVSYKTSSNQTSLAAVAAVIKTTAAIGKEYLTQNNIE